ncbi:MAG TPA: silent information regulator protein Sir2 [Candidatus Lokiarchaeia archaeon]|nr:silent information regulator protein Sir2 [Candidatus Lokiarchaeia archaeon]
MLRFLRFVFKHRSGMLQPTGTKPQVQPVQAASLARVRETLHRGLIVMETTNGAIYMSWRLLPEDSLDIGFHVYRETATSGPILLNSDPIVQTTDFIDIKPSSDPEATYWVVPVNEGIEEPAGSSARVRILNHERQPFISIPLPENIKFQNLAIADLDGDGEYEFIIKWPDEEIDPFKGAGWHRSATTYNLDAYRLDGTRLWRYDLGWDIETGVWYSPFVAFDFNGDGRAEVAVKTGERNGDHRNWSGRVKSGPEFLTILDGGTGEEITRKAWPPRYREFYSWQSRNMIGVAYLDGIHPFVLLERGTYNVMYLDAYRLEDNGLIPYWHWNSHEEPGWDYFGQGGHQLHVADLDGDGFDEILLGTCAIDHDGTGLWSTGLQHCDHAYVGKIDPRQPGLQVYFGIEGVLPGAKSTGLCLVDAKTGNLIWSSSDITYHVHNHGLVSDIDARYPGMECYSGEQARRKRWLYSADGTLIADESNVDWGLSPNAVYWDGDLQREILYQGRIFDFPTDHTWMEGISENTQVSSQGENYFNCFIADLFGDWREEIIVSVPGEIRIYTTTIPAVDRRVTLMNDPIYRMDVAFYSSGYAQPPMTSFWLAEKRDVEMRSARENG